MNLFLRSNLALVACLFFSAVSMCQGQDGKKESAKNPGSQKSTLRILFVGSDPEVKIKPPSYLEGKSAKRYSELRQERTPAFKSLLEEHFREVTILNAVDYKPALSDNFDVTVFDARPPAIEQIDMGNWTKKIRMPYDFDRPAVMIGNIAPMTLGRNSMGLRLDHL
ncbi:MAG: hypothetical protein AB8B55_13160 [Mariniblastus sp.]